MTYQYDDSQYDPPAPILPVTISVPGGEKKLVEIDGLLDTGADIVCCPEVFIDALGAQPAGTRQVFGVNEVFVDTCNTYFLEFEIVGAKQLVEVAALGQDVILGRNLVNGLVIRLDGNAQELSIE